MKEKKKRKKKRIRKRSAVHYSLASASLLFISALCSLSAVGGAVRAPSALFFLDARPDAPCLSLAFLGGLWLTEVFFALELWRLGFSTCTERQTANRNTERAGFGGRIWRDDVISGKITLMKAQDSEKHGM